MKNKNKNKINITSGNSTESNTVTLSNSSGQLLTTFPTTANNTYIGDGTYINDGTSWHIVDNFDPPILSEFEKQDIRVGLLEKVIEEKINMKRYKELMKVINSPTASKEQDDIKIIIEIANS